MHLFNIILANITFGEIESKIQIKYLIDVEWEVSKQRECRLKNKIATLKSYWHRYFYIVSSVLWMIHSKPHVAHSN